MEVGLIGVVSLDLTVTYIGDPGGPGGSLAGALWSSRSDPGVLACAILVFENALWKKLQQSKKNWQRSSE